MVIGLHRGPLPEKGSTVPPFNSQVAAAVPKHPRSAQTECQGLMRPLLPHPSGKSRGLVTLFQQDHGGALRLRSRVL